MIFLKVSGSKLCEVGHSCGTFEQREDELSTLQSFAQGEVVLSK
jgi:hypothetical protein